MLMKKKLVNKWISNYRKLIPSRIYMILINLGATIYLLLNYMEPIPRHTTAKTGKENIVNHLLGNMIRRIEIFNYLIDDEMINIIVDCTNAYITSIAESFKRGRATKTYLYNSSSCSNRFTFFVRKAPVLRSFFSQCH